MHGDLVVLTLTAASVGFLHTVTGPDHYLPFVMIGRARHWGYGKLAAVTALCGVGHVLSSILIALVGVAAGLALSHLQALENLRGNWAAYALMGFGIAYTLWGLRKAWRGEVHSHLHHHADGTVHAHPHDHRSPDHLHPHGDAESITVWVLFAIFVLGPCEPLIPLAMVPAARHSWVGLLWIAGIFGLLTVGTMVATALFLYSGVRRISLPWLERYMHALAGLVITLSGAAIVFLGL